MNPRNVALSQKRLSLSNVAAISAGSYHNLALETNQAIVAWGDDSYGELGVTTTSSSTATPVAVNLNGTYTYNGDGLRTKKVVNGQTTGFTYDGASGSTPLLLSDGTNDYIYGPDDLPLEQIAIQGGGVAWYHHDQLGSTRTLTNSAGTVTGTESYGPYGQPTFTGTPTPLAYAAAYTDTETGLLYLINRYYDPTTGHFLSLDPISPLTQSHYTYAGDNPLDAVDPLGLFCYRTPIGSYGPPDCLPGPPDPNNPNEVATPTQAMNSLPCLEVIPAPSLLPFGNSPSSYPGYGAMASVVSIGAGGLTVLLSPPPPVQGTYYPPAAPTGSDVPGGFLQCLVGSSHGGEVGERIAALIGEGADLIVAVGVAAGCALEP